MRISKRWYMVYKPGPWGAILMKRRRDAVKLANEDGAGEEVIPVDVTVRKGKIHRSKDRRGESSRRVENWLKKSGRK